MNKYANYRGFELQFVCGRVLEIKRNTKYHFEYSFHIDLNSIKTNHQMMMMTLRNGI